MNEKQDSKKATEADATPSRMEEMVAKAVKDALSETLPVVAAVLAQARPPAAASGAAPTSQKLDLADRCHQCGQARVACRDQHAKLYVGPANHRRLRSFPGVTVNGVTYRSTTPGEKVTVPLLNDVLHRVSVWETSEEDRETGRQVNHDSGVLSGQPGHSRVNAANPHGFSGLMPT